MDCKYVMTRDEMIKWASNPRFIAYKQISEDLCAVFLRRRSVEMKQAFGIGFTILER